MELGAVSLLVGEEGDRQVLREGVVGRLRGLDEFAETADDPLTEDLAVTLLADEEAHRTEFHGFEKEYRED